MRRLLLEPPLESMVGVHHLRSPVAHQRPQDRREARVPVDERAETIERHPPHACQRLGVVAGMTGTSRWDSRPPPAGSVMVPPKTSRGRLIGSLWVMPPVPRVP